MYGDSRCHLIKEDKAAVYFLGFYSSEGSDPRLSDPHRNLLTLVLTLAWCKVWRSRRFIPLGPPLTKQEMGYMFPHFII